MRKVWRNTRIPQQHPSIDRVPLRGLDSSARGQSRAVNEQTYYRTRTLMSGKMTMVQQAPDQPASAISPARPALADPIPVAIVGAGYIAEYHLEVLGKLPNVQVVGVCDPDQRRLDAICTKWSIPHRASSPRELFELVHAQVAHILVPPPLHYQVTSEVLHEGIHALVEKPLALSDEECADLIQLAESKGLFLGVNHNAAYHPAFQRLLRDVAQGKLGRIEHVVSSNNLPLAQLESGQHDHWMFRSPENILFEQGPHPLSQVCALLGAVRDVQTSATHPRRLRGGNLFFTRWQHHFKCSGGTADLFLAFGGTYADARLHVIGQDGVAHLDLLDNIYLSARSTHYMAPVDRLIRQSRQSAASAWQGVTGMLSYIASTLRVIDRRDPYYLSMHACIEDFYRSLRSGGGGHTSAMRGRDVIAGLAMAAQRVPSRRPEQIERVTAPAAETVGGRSRVASEQATDKPRVLVLGGTGFIGRRLVALLAETGYPLRLMLRSPGRGADLAAEYGLELQRGDITNAADLDAATAGCGVVVHLVAGAPETWSGFEELFVRGTERVADACLRHGVGQLLFASSITAYYLGKPGVTVTESQPLEPHPRRRCHYARAKIEAEDLLMERHRSAGLPVTIFRPGIVIGPGSPVQHLGVGQWAGGRHCISWGSKTRRELPFVLVDDVAAAFAQAIGRAELAGRSFNLVGDVRPSAEEYLQLLRAESGRDMQLHRQSLLYWSTLEWMKWGIKAVARKPENSRMTYRELAYRSAASRFDCEAAKRDLGWRPVASLEEFIEQGIRSPLRNHELSS